MIDDALRKALQAAVESTSQREVAKQCGVPQQTLSAFLREDRDLSLRNAAMVAQWLGLELRPARRAQNKAMRS